MSDDATELFAEVIPALQMLARVWKLSYLTALERLRNDPEAGLEEFIEAAWELGILNHVSPDDQATRQARQRLGRTLWRPRTDPVLYWRILYSLERIRANIEHTMTSGPNVFAVIELMKALGDLPRDQLRGFFPKLQHDPGWPWYARICEQLIDRARQTLRAMGVTPHDPILRRGSEGVFRNIRCRIDAIGDDGTFFLVPTGEDARRNPFAFLALMDRPGNEKSVGICPSLIDFSLFTPAASKS